MKIILPAGMDLHLLGTKTHDSELRLAKYLIKTLKEGDSFIDLGAHFGYFSLLASRLVGPEGKVYAFDASASTFQYLAQNLAGHQNIDAFHLAVSDRMGKKISFYEFPVLYSEFNSLNAEQYESESWFKKIKPKKTEVDSVTMDHFITQFNCHPHLVKIDVEGGELDALNGMLKALQTIRPPIIMEFSTLDTKNKTHWQAYDLLKSYGYFSHLINQEGEGVPCKDLKAYFGKISEESDNILFLPQ